MPRGARCKLLQSIWRALRCPGPTLAPRLRRSLALYRSAADSRKLLGNYITETNITNAEFAKFVKATGYITVAERTPTKEEFPLY